MTFDLNTAEFTFDFIEGTMKLLTMAGNEPVVAYTSEYKGRENFAIRRLYTADDGDSWSPGKGLSVPASKAEELCQAIAAMTAPKAKATPKKTKAA